ncbi:MAG: TetR family transcriptional regulator [Acidimicrobiales bacterium]
MTSATAGAARRRAAGHDGATVPPADAGRSAGASAGQAVRRTRAVGEEQKEARRRQILLAAKAVFADQGFAATTMADVARSASLSYGAVYWYFTSKDELFHALMELEAEALHRCIVERVGDVAHQGPEVALTHAVAATFRFFEEDRAAVKLLFRDSIAMGERFEAHVFGIYERFIDELTQLVAAAQKQGEIVAVPPRLAAFSVAALVGQLALRRLATDDGVSAAVVADFAVRLVMDGLRPR